METIRCNSAHLKSLERLDASLIHIVNKLNLDVRFSVQAFEFAEERIDTGRQRRDAGGTVSRISEGVLDDAVINSA
ncbi:MAG: hypothetical protein NXI27_21480 [Alphaproteobacteria bacterium]|nr:hypothetical protein [Alphaproteobacteria bacterium]